MDQLKRHDYECTYAGGIITNYGPTKLYLLLKIINPVKSIGVSNLKHEIDRSTLANFGNNVKDLLNYMYSNYSIIIDKVERHEDCVRHIFRNLLLGPNSFLII